MFLACSYFLRNLSLNVLINMVLIKQKACMPLLQQSNLLRYILRDDLDYICHFDFRLLPYTYSTVYVAIP